MIILGFVLLIGGLMLSIGGAYREGNWIDLIPVGWVSTFIGSAILSQHLVGIDWAVLR